MKELHRILVEPYFTEKTSSFMSENGSGVFNYAFKVAVDANKIEIKQAIEKRFEVKVDNVRTVLTPGKLKRVRMIAGRTAKWKKAYVKLQPGFKISEFEGAI